MLTYNEKKAKVKENVIKDEFGFKMLDEWKSANYIESVLHVTYGTNSKTGETFTFNLPIAYSCRHDALCRLTGNCYCRKSSYEYPNALLNQYENLKFLHDHDWDTIYNEFCRQILLNVQCKLFRWFGCGEVISRDFFEKVMIRLANTFKDITFWAYTKRHTMVNQYFKKHGIESKPNNFSIIFSVWTNDDTGEVEQIENPFNFPIAVFIPLKFADKLKNKVTYICECAMPWRKGHCDECKHGCKDLKFGESVGFIEHTTDRTRKKDNTLKKRREECELLGIDTREKYINHYGMDEFVF